MCGEKIEFMSAAEIKDEREDMVVCVSCKIDDEFERISLMTDEELHDLDQPYLEEDIDYV
jgi:hypothetical protein